MKTALSLLFFGLTALPLAAAEWPVTIDWQYKVSLSTPLTGRVASVNVDVGDRVTEGQLLAALDARLFEAEVKSARSILQRNKVAFEESERAFERATELYDRTVLSTTDFQQAELAHAIATANYNNSQAELAKAKINREYTQIRSPFAAIVLKRHVNSGQTVSNQFQVQPMLELAELGKMMAIGWLRDSAVQELTTGQSVKINLGGKQVSAVIKSIGTDFRDENNDSLYRVEFQFQSPEGMRLFAGMRGQVVIP